MSTFTLLPVIKQESESLMCVYSYEKGRRFMYYRVLTASRLLGGFFMFSLGLLYMMFGEAVANGGDGAQVARGQDWVSKSILGFQVCCIAPGNLGEIGMPVLDRY